MASSGKRRVAGEGSRVSTRKGEAGPRVNLYDEVTQRIIAELEAGRFPWVQPWDSRVTGGPGLPMNALTGRRYSGINVLLLWGAAIGGVYARLALFDLELSEIFYGCSIGRAPKIRCKPRDVPHIVELGLPREPAHVHVFDHALTQRSGRGIRQNLGHGTTPQLKGAAIVCLLGPELNLGSGRRSLARPQNKRHSRASGFVHVPRAVFRHRCSQRECMAGFDATTRSTECPLCRRQLSTDLASLASKAQICSCSLRLSTLTTSC